MEGLLIRVGRWSISPAQILGFFPLTVVAKGSDKGVSQNVLQIKWIGFYFFLPIFMLSTFIIFLFAGGGNQNSAFAETFSSRSSDITIFVMFSVVQTINGVG